MECESHLSVYLLFEVLFASIKEFCASSIICGCLGCLNAFMCVCGCQQVCVHPDVLCSG